MRRLLNFYCPIDQLGIQGDGSVRERERIRMIAPHTYIFSHLSIVVFTVQNGINQPIYAALHPPDQISC
uniref:Uncharacterized protein n=1 Tax=Setaria italica TaxID=4555 RepID=K3ZBJ1_SETIT